MLGKSAGKSKSRGRRSSKNSSVKKSHSRMISNNSIDQKMSKSRNSTKKLLLTSPVIRSHSVVFDVKPSKSPSISDFGAKSKKSQYSS